MTGRSNFFSRIMRRQENNTVSIINKIIETHHSRERHHNYFEGITKRIIKRVHYNGNDGLPEGKVLCQVIYPNFNKYFDIDTDNCESQIGVVINQSVRK